MSNSELLTSIVWEDIPLGAEYGPYSDVATQEERNLWAQVYEQPSDNGTAVPPGLVPIYVLRALRAAFNGIPPGGVLARQTFDFAMPLEIGQPFQTTIRVVDKYTKRGWPYVVLAYSIYLHNFELIAESRQRLIWPRREEEGSPSDAH